MLCLARTKMSRLTLRIIWYLRQSGSRCPTPGGALATLGGRPLSEAGWFGRGGPGKGLGT